MGASTRLKDSVQHTYDGLAVRLEDARRTCSGPEPPRRGCPPIDMFCCGVSQHLHAVDEVLLPRAPRAQVHAEQVAAHRLEIELAHVKAHEFGSTYEQSFPWPRIWDDVADAMRTQRETEERLVELLTESLPDEEIDRLAARMAEVEPREPTRPHPYVPHRGIGGWLARRAMRMADGFWDTVEGRSVPERPRPARKAPGLIGQYFLADPRFKEEEEEV